MKWLTYIIRDLGEPIQGPLSVDVNFGFYAGDHGRFKPLLIISKQLFHLAALSPWASLAAEARKLEPHYPHAPQSAVHIF